MGLEIPADGSRRNRAERGDLGCRREERRAMQVQRGLAGLAFTWLFLAGVGPNVVHAKGEAVQAMSTAVLAATAQNTFLAIQVRSDGRFNLGANPSSPPCGSGPAFTVPCRYNLSFA